MTVDRATVLSPRWLGTLLGADPAAPLRLQPLPAAGLVSETVLVEATGPGGPRRCVVKLPPADPMIRSLVAPLRLFEREVAFYRAFASGMGELVPASLHGEYSDTDGTGVLVLDHVDASSTTLVEPFDEPATGQVLAAVARLHARHSAMPPPAWLPGADAPQLHILGGQLHGHRELVYRHWGALGDALEQVMDAGARGIARAVDAAWTSGPSTLIHGDLRAGNVLFRPDGRAVLIDWQTVMQGPAAFDIAYLLGSSIEECTGKELAAFVDAYLQALAVEGAAVTRAELWSGLAPCAVLGAAQALTTWCTVAAAGEVSEHLTGLAAWVKRSLRLVRVTESASAEPVG